MRRNVFTIVATALLVFIGACAVSPYKQGSNLARKGAYEEALRQFQHVIASEPNNMKSLGGNRV